jgi:hypothetical protein
MSLNFLCSRDYLGYSEESSGTIGVLPTLRTCQRVVIRRTSVQSSGGTPPRSDYTTFCQPLPFQGFRKRQCRQAWTSSISKLLFSFSRLITTTTQHLVMFTIINLAFKIFKTSANQSKRLFRDEQNRTNNMMQRQAAKPGSTLVSLKTGLMRHPTGRTVILSSFNPDLFASPPLRASQTGLSTKMLKQNTRRHVMPSRESP